MDMFMDKLAQRLNAQEIIKANTTAEIEELDKLRSRVAEYNDCLDRLQKLVNEGAEGIKSASGENVAAINRLVEESLAKLREIQQDASGLEKLGGQLENVSGQLGNTNGQLESVNGQLGNMSGQLGNTNGQLESVSGQLGNMSGQLDNVNGQLGNMSGQLDNVNGRLGDMNGRLENVSGQLENMSGAISDKIDRLSGQLEEKPADKLEEKFAIADENVHKECVKVYRNVQAVVMEESGKQGETLTEISGKLNVMKSRLGIVLGISVAALVFSLAGAVLQLMDLLGIGLL